MAIAEAEAKLANLQAQLEEIEVLKAREPKLRREAAALEAKIEDMKAAEVAGESEKQFFAKEDEEEEEESPPVPAPKPKEAPAAPRDAEGERKAKLRAVNKKLTQIEKLKTKDSLDADAQAKLASEPKLRKQLAALEAGEEYEDSEEEEEEDAPAPAPAPVAKAAAKKDDDIDMTAAKVKLPTDPAEVEKRLKNLNKKLQQIAKLKEKGGVLDEEAKQKIASEHRINQEVAALEAGNDEVVFVDKTAEEEKFELEKKVKALNKKLDAIKKLKNDGDLDADKQAKIDSESGLLKEKGALERQIGEINKAERERVAERLGWETGAKAAGKKKGKK